MKNIAIILAGGMGIRMGQSVPKQFVNIYDKPILIYTLEGFQKHPQIDEIEVVCIKGWIDVVKAYAKQFHISKLKWIVEGGETVQESIKNGLFYLESQIEDNDIVVIHDGIRPMVDIEVLTDVLLVAHTYGNAVTSLLDTEQIFIVDKNDEKVTNQFIPRESVRKVSTPQAYEFKKINQIYHQAFKANKGIDGPFYADTLMVDYGEKLFFSAGSRRNIKIVTEDDLYLFKAFLRIDRDV